MKPGKIPLEILQVRFTFEFHVSTSILGTRLLSLQTHLLRYQNFRIFFFGEGS